MRRAPVVLVLALTLSSGCSGNGGLLEPGQMTALRLVNAAPDAPPVDFLFRGSKIRQALAYDNGTGYIYFGAGSGDIVVQNNVGDILLDYPVSLAGGSSYTFAITGSVSALQPVFLTDDTTAAPVGSFKVRLVHLATQGPPMDLYVTAANADLTTATPVATNVAFTQTSGYVTAPPGTVQFRLTQTGTKTVLRDVGTFPLASGQGVTLFVVGAAGAGGGGAPYTSQLVADHSGTN